MFGSVGINIGVEGEEEYSRSLKNITAETKAFQSEFKALQSSFSNNASTWDKSQLSASVLTDEIKAQYDKLEALKDAQSKYAVGSTQWFDYADRINKATDALNKMEKQLEALPNHIQAIGQDFENWGGKLEDAGKKVSKVGDALSKVSVPVAGALAASAKEAISFESAMTGVQKTVDGTEETYAHLAEGVKRLSTETASSKTELAGTMEILGQLGYTAEDGGAALIDMTKVMTMLGDSTNMTAETAATNLARFANIMGTTEGDMQKLGSAIVDLGNNFATDEESITIMATRMASAGKVAGMTEQDILGLATALSSVGIKEEAGATAMSQTLNAIQKAVEGIGEESDDLGKAQEKVEKKTQALEKAQLKYNQALSESGENSAKAQTALLNIEKAQSKYNQAVEKYGADSEQAYQAQIGIEQAQIKYNEVLSSSSKKVETAQLALAQAQDDLAGAQAELNVAMDGGGKKIETYARVAGMAADEFIAKWKEDPAAALQAFIKGLGNLDEESESTVSILNELGLEGVRQSNSLRALAQASDLMTNALDTADRAWDENIALVTEAERRYGTHESKIHQAKEGLTNLAVEIGERLFPYIERGLDFADKIIGKWDQLDEGTQDFIVKAGMVVAVAGPILSIGGRFISGIGTIVSGVGGLIKVIGGLAGAGTGVASGLGSIVGAVGSVTGAIGAGSTGLIGAIGGLASAFVPFLVGGAVVVGVGLGVNYMYKHFDWFREKADKFCGAVKKTFTDSLDAIKTKYQQWGGGIKGVVGAAFEAMHQATFAGLHLIDNLTGGKLTEIKNKFTSAFESIVSSTGKFGEDMIENYRAGVEKGQPRFVAAIVGIGKTIWDYLHHSTPELGYLADDDKWMPDMMNMFANGISENIGVVVGKIQELGAGIANTFSDLVSDAKKLWEKMISDTHEAVKKVGTLIKDGWENAKKLTKDAWENMKELIHSAWETMKDKTHEAVNNIGDKIRSGWEEAKNRTREAWETMANKVRDAVEYMRDRVHENVNNIHDKFVSTFNSLIESAQSWGHSIVENIANGINGAWGWAVGAAQNIAGAIGDVFGNMISNAWNWGKDMISNLTSGISNRLSEVKNSIMNVAGSIADRIGFSEPKEGPLSNFHTYMPDMMKELAKGIYQNMGLVEDATSTLAAALLPDIDSGTIRGRGGNSTSITNGPLTVNVYGAEGQDVRELARIVEQEITFNMNRRNVVLA